MFEYLCEVLHLFVGSSGVEDNIVPAHTWNFKCFRRETKRSSVCAFEILSLKDSRVTMGSQTARPHQTGGRGGRKTWRI